MANTNRIHDIEKALYKGKINTPFAAVPFTDIKNEQGQPRRIADLTQNLKAHFGVERIHTKSLKKVSGEVGPNGENVFETNSRDERIRFVGDWNAYSSVNGTYTAVTTAADTTSFVEITFYGTGLNMLGHYDVNDGDFRASVNGGAEGPNLYDTNSPSILNVRNYEMNAVRSVTSGLSLGWHTVKIRNNGGPTNQIIVMGFEILNESSQIVVNSGQPFQGGHAAKLDTQTLLDIKPSDLTGTKGGRVITYIDEEGNLGQAVTVVDPSITGNPSAPELITNGDFPTDVSGWSDWASGLSWNAAGEMQYNYSSDRGAYQVFSTTIGKTYELKYDVTFISTQVNNAAIMALKSDPSNSLTIGDGADLGFEIHPHSSGEEGSHSIIFTATTSSMQVTMGCGGNVSGSARFDNISIKEVGYNFKALSNTDHSDEEIYRKINFREFGRNRGDDFSTLAGADGNRTFTLDDGTTTLMGSSVHAPSYQGINGLAISTNGDYFVLTFVGTGLDIEHIDSAIGSNTGNYRVTIDGIIVGDWNEGKTTLTRRKIASGLPYGTHTVKFEANGSINVYALSVVNFILYHSKKPALPEDVIELTDYSVMADYAKTSEAGENTISQGVLRKDNMREMLYSGANWGVELNIGYPYIGGIQTYTTQAGQYVEYTFVGTGFEIRHKGFSSYSTDMLFTVDGVSLTAANFPSATFNEYGYDTGYNSTTGSLNMRSTGDKNGCGFGVSGLPYGKHTVRITNNVGGQTMSIEAFDIITPIHINDTKAGSMSLKDLRTNAQIEDEAASKVDLSKAKAWLVFSPAEGRVLKSFNVSAVFKNGQFSTVYFKRPFKDRYSYGAVMMVGDYEDASADVGQASPTEIQKSYMKLHTTQNGAANDTMNFLSVFFFGELEDEENINLEEL